ncbi:MAG: glycosyltransferase family 4 protein, partial [bacterium]
RYFLSKGESTTIIAPQGSWVANECKKDGAILAAYDYDQVVSQDDENMKTWADGLKDCDVAVCTVHPPRETFHCSVFAAECIKKYGLKTVLIPKTGTIVPEYARAFYLPEPSIRSTVIAITDFTRKYLLDTYKIPSDMVELIYQGTEVDRFTADESRMPEALARYRLSEAASPILGCVGVFEERKGQTILLQAVSQLAREIFPGIHLMFVGEGPDEEMLKDKIHEMSLEENVSLFPFTREPEYVFERIDILVLSSLRKEGLPNVLLEAMSMGIPVVSSKLAGVPEVVKNGETGFMVTPGNAAELAQAIEKLWFDKIGYREMARNARRLMETKFDKKQQFDAFLRYFHRIAG